MRQKISQQLLPLPSGNNKGQQWHAMISEKLGVKPTPGWPDKFGDELRKWLNEHKSPKVKALSLFSGGGGLDIAFHDAGFDVVEMVEFEARFCKTLEANTLAGKRLNGGTVKCIDIRDYTPPKDLKVDFIIGGPPCQTFSAAGRRAAGVKGTSDPRGTLFQEYVRLLKQLKPRGFLFENVYGIIGAEGGKAWAEIQEAFISAGYMIRFRVLDAADYGVPQHRERLFIVGIKIGDPAESVYKFPRPTHGPDANSPCDFYSAGTAVKDGFKADTTSNEIRGRWGHLITGIPPGLNYSFYTKELGHPKPVFAWRSKFSDFMYKADPDLPVRPIKAQGGAYTGPFSWENRHFSSSEIKRLQTFPDNYEVVGSRNVQVHQLGNSVPPQLGRMLALSIKDRIFGHKMPISIEYIEDDYLLGFRTRKRELTEYYAQKAYEAISGLKKSPQVKQTSSLRKGSKVSLTTKFELKSSDHNKPRMVDGAITLFKKCNRMEVEITQDPAASSKASCSIHLSPAGKNPWSIELSSASVKITNADLKGVTLAWKTLELAIRELHGIDDLVQLYGYYQYLPKFNAELEFNGNWNDKDDLCSIVSKVAKGIAVGRQMLSSEMADILCIKPSKLEGKLKGLRKLGYEIRSNNTNPQINPGEYLIPYTFPSLTNRSVQLNKSL